VLRASQCRTPGLYPGAGTDKQAAKHAALMNAAADAPGHARSEVQSA
jgi:hypothetical protein